MFLLPPADGRTPRYVIGNSHGHGWFVIDTRRQTKIKGPYPTREAARREKALLDREAAEEN